MRLMLKLIASVNEGLFTLENALIVGHILMNIL